MVFQKHSATLPCMMILAANTDLYLNHYLLINEVVFEVPYLIHTHPTGYLITQHLQKILSVYWNCYPKNYGDEEFYCTVILKIIYLCQVATSRFTHYKFITLVNH